MKEIEERKKFQLRSFEDRKKDRLRSFEDRMKDILKSFEYRKYRQRSFEDRKKDILRLVEDRKKDILRSVEDRKKDRLKLTECYNKESRKRGREKTPLGRLAEKEKGRGEKRARESRVYEFFSQGPELVCALKVKRSTTETLVNIAAAVSMMKSETFF